MKDSDDMVQECPICGEIDAHKRWFGVKAAEKLEDGSMRLEGKIQRAHEECLRTLDYEGNIFNGKP